MLGCRTTILDAQSGSNGRGREIVCQIVWAFFCFSFGQIIVIFHGETNSTCLQWHAQTVSSTVDL